MASVDAGTGPPDDADDLAFPDVDADVVDGQEAVVVEHAASGLVLLAKVGGREAGRGRPPS